MRYTEPVLSDQGLLLVGETNTAAGFTGTSLVLLVLCCWDSVQQQWPTVWDNTEHAQRAGSTAQRRSFALSEGGVIVVTADNEYTG